MFIYELAQRLGISTSEAITLLDRAVSKLMVFGFSEDVDANTWVTPSEAQLLVDIYVGLEYLVAA